MPYDCQNELCRWRHFNGEHRDVPHAVWWGCTPRPRSPFRKGDVVRRTDRADSPEETVASAGWDSGLGWHIQFEHNGWLSNPHDPALYCLAATSAQPTLLELAGVS